MGLSFIIPHFLDGMVRWPVKKQRVNAKKHGDGVHTFLPRMPEPVRRCQVEVAQDKRRESLPSAK